MTTLIIDCKNQTVYADMQATQTLSTNASGLISGLVFEDRSRNITKGYQHNYIKAERLHDGRVICGTGSAFVLEACVDNLKTYGIMPVPKGDWDQTTIFISTNKGLKQGLQVDKYELRTKGFWKNKQYWECSTTLKEDGFITAGSGGDYAAGGLQAGLSPEEVLREVVPVLDTYSNGEVYSVEVKG